MNFHVFSSRRRHTRFDCDWSSDVCSSDLTLVKCKTPLPYLLSQEVRMRSSSAFSAKFFRTVNVCLFGIRDCFLVAIFVLTILSSLSRAQTAPLFRIAYGTTGENPTALWLGVEQGFYRKHGLNVETIYMRSGPLAMAAMASGDVQMNFTSANNVLNA